MTAPSTRPAAPADPDVVVRTENLVHVYGVPGSEVAALRGVDLEVRRGETLALLGPSGSGKSTLLWHLAGLLRPSAGIVEVRGRRLSGLSAAELARVRQSEIGVVLQNAARNLLPYISAADNVRAVMAGAAKRGRSRRAAELLAAVGLADRAGQAAGRLSGGEQQRLALAVALANAPALLLADEPTSHLDVDSAAAVLDLIREANRRDGTTVVVVTHDATVGQALGRTLTIRDGRIGGAGFAGQDYLVVDRNGTVQLPSDLFDALPPGSLARAVRTEFGVELQRVGPGSVGGPSPAGPVAGAGYGPAEPAPPRPGPDPGRPAGPPARGRGPGAIEWLGADEDRDR